MFAENRYFELLTGVEALISSGSYSIELLGSEKYGYILSENGKVNEFLEKPNADTAKKLIKNGALWNCGVFALKIGYILELAHKQVNFDSYESLLSQYDVLPKFSFNYEIAEKESSIGVVNYSGVWKDLGTWNTLTEEMDGHILGKNILLSEDRGSTHVLDMLDIPVISLGIKDTVIVASHDGILVSDKNASARLKPYTEKVAC